MLDQPVPNQPPNILDKNVPNPVAKNPNFFTHKVVAAIGIILVGTIVVLFGLALIYHVNLADLFSTIPATDKTKVSTTSAQPAGTSDWSTYTNTTVGYIIKYPKNWVSSSTSEEKDCGVRFGLNKDQLGTCVPGNGNLLQSGLVTIRVINDTLSNQVNNSKSIAGFEQSNATLGGKTSVKITGTQNGNKEIEYLVDMGGSVLSVGFYAWPENTSDYSTDFEKMVSTIKFDETADWKTYTNSFYNYSLKYPNTINVFNNNGAEGTTVTSSNDIVFTDDSNINSNQSTLQNFVSKNSIFLQFYLTDMSSTVYKTNTFDEIVNYDYSKNKTASKSITSLSPISLDGVKAYSYSTTGSTSITATMGSSWLVDQENLRIIAAQKGSVVFYIIYRNNSTVEKMISTFKFL